MGNAYKMQGAYDKALLKYSEAIEFFPKDIEFNLSLADIYYIGGLLQQAAEVYKKVLLLDPSNTHAKLALARAFLDGGSFSRASQYFKEYIDAVDTRDAKVYYDYALSYFMATNYERAFELTVKAAEFGETADTALLTAKILKARGQKEEAFKKINEAARRWPDREDIYLTCAMWLAFDKNYNKESLEMAEAYLKKHRGNRLALFIKYTALRSQGRGEEAVRNLKAVVSYDSGGFIENLALRILDGKPGAPKSADVLKFD
jgi:tetratricopeptide (TPR) repeat protein